MSHWMTSGSSRLKVRQNRTFSTRAQQRASLLNGGIDAAKTSVKKSATKRLRRNTQGRKSLTVQSRNGQRWLPQGVVAVAVSTVSQYEGDFQDENDYASSPRRSVRQDQQDNAEDDSPAPGQPRRIRNANASFRIHRSRKRARDSFVKSDGIDLSRFGSHPADSMSRLSDHPVEGAANMARNGILFPASSTFQTPLRSLENFRPELSMHDDVQRSFCSAEKLFNSSGDLPVQTHFPGANHLMGGMAGMAGNCSSKAANPSSPLIPSKDGGNFFSLPLEPGYSDDKNKWVLGTGKFDNTVARAGDGMEDGFLPERFGTNQLAEPGVRRFARDALLNPSVDDVGMPPPVSFVETFPKAARASTSSVSALTKAPSRPSEDSFATENCWGSPTPNSNTGISRFQQKRAKRKMSQPPEVSVDNDQRPSRGEGISGSSKSVENQETRHSPIRFFNNGIEVDFQGNPLDQLKVQNSRTPSRETPARGESPEATSTPSSEFERLQAYQKSIWDVFASPENPQNRGVCQQRSGGMGSLTGTKVASQDAGG